MAYGPIGGHDRSVTHDRVARLAKLQPLAGSQNPAVAMAHERWSLIERHYRAWLAGQETPTEGTPLAAWNALTPEQADVLRTNQIKTVEEVAALTDAHISRFPLPKLRELVAQAKAFVDSANQRQFAANLMAKEREIEHLKAANTERDEQIAALIAKVDELAGIVAGKEDGAENETGAARGEPAKRKGGWPLGKPRKPAGETSEAA